MQLCRHVPVVAAELICGECFSRTAPVVLLEISFSGLQSGEWLLQQFPVSASTCISVSFRDVRFPVIGDAKLISSERALAEKQLQRVSPSFNTYPLCEKYLQMYCVEPPSLLDVGLTSCGLNLKRNQPQNKANKQKNPIKTKNNPQTECLAGFAIFSSLSSQDHGCTVL